MSIAKYQSSTIVGPAPKVVAEVCTVNDVSWGLHAAWLEAEEGDL